MHNDDVRDRTFVWLWCEDGHDESRTDREQQIISVCGIDTVEDPYRLKHILRFSYELDIPNEDLFRFCLWCNTIIPSKVPMPAQVYKLEFSLVYEPLKLLGVAGGKVNASNLWKVIPVLAKLGQKIPPGDYYDHISYLVAGCYGIDGPWTWHLRRCIRKIDASAFESVEYCKQFVEWYVGYINKVEHEVFAETGAPISSIILRTQDRITLGDA